MGVGSSRRRRNSPPPPRHLYALPPPPLSYLHHHPPSNGPFMPPLTSHYYPPSTYHDPRYQHPSPYSFPENEAHPPPTGISDSSSSPQQSSAITVRNSVNIQKETIKLQEDDANPGFYLLSFSFGADFPGSFNIFYLANVGENCSVKPVSSYIFKPLRIPFEKGYGQTFKQETGTGIYLDAIDKEDLERETQDEACPLVIRAQTVPRNRQHEPVDEDIGGPLPKSVNAQLTQAVIERKGSGVCKVRVLQQVIWVDGVRYELKELYGIETTVDDGGYDEDDLGKDCVICLSETRDMAVIPCRHVCMCSGCASNFRAQMNRCPICRQPVASLLKINVNA